MKKIEDIFLEIEQLLISKKYEEAKEYMLNYHIDSAKTDELKMILVATKAFKQHEILGAPRKMLLDLIEKKLGFKLV